MTHLHQSIANHKSLTYQKPAPSLAALRCLQQERKHTNKNLPSRGFCRFNRSPGFTIIELLVYVSAFALVATAIILFVFDLIQVQAKIRINKEVSDNSQRMMEIMLLEIKNAIDLYLPDSVFDSHPGKLSLETIRYRPEGENTTYLDFYLDENSRLLFKKEGEPAESLTSKNVKITKLIFRRLTAANTESIRIELTAIYDNPNQRAAYRAISTLISSASLRRQ